MGDMTGGIASVWRRAARSNRASVAAPRVAPSRLHPADLVGIGLVGLRTRRLRAALTAAGIAIGIAAMVAVLGISESSRADLLASLDRLGTNLLTVAPGNTFRGEAATLPLTAPDMIERIAPVESVSSVANVSAAVRRSDHIPEEQTGGITVVAADLELLDTLRGSVAEGSFLNAATAQLPAVVLGATSAERLGIDRVGVRVWLGEQWFTVVGILSPLELAPDLDATAMVGYPIAATAFEQDGSASAIFVRSSPEAVEAVRGVLGRTANPENPNEAEVARPSDALEARAATATAFTALFVGLGAVALVVGGVGIANVMLMSVLERRSEIGLRRALGATRRHIALQFVAEALIVASLGGIFGVVLGAAIGVGYAVYREWAPIVPLVALVSGIGAALAIGVVAGLYPAVRAARVSPTDALRGI
jgi:putative ABC transport system permease protein